MSMSVYGTDTLSLEAQNQPKGDIHFELFRTGKSPDLYKMLLFIKVSGKDFEKASVSLSIVNMNGNLFQ